MSSDIESKISQLKKDFPALNNENIHYLDNAASTLKPRQVIDKVVDCYENYPANIYRGLYEYSKRASEEYSLAREKVASFIHSKCFESIIFTSGATASSNLFSQSFTRGFLSAGDEVILSFMEHHSNIVNWQYWSSQIGFKIRYAPLSDDKMSIDIEQFKASLSDKTKLVSIVHISNLTGSINDIKKIVELAHDNNIPVCADISQSVAHTYIDVQDWDVDFAYFSGHKMFAPTGIGIFYMKPEWFNKLPLFFYGGGMISTVEKYSFTTQEAPYSFEAGTPPIAQAIGLGAAVDYIHSIGIDTIQEIEHYLYEETSDMLKKYSYIHTLITKPQAALFSFNIEGVHPHDVGAFLNEDHIAVRIGKHCTSLFLDELDIFATVRASFAFYNNKADILALEQSLVKVWEFFHAAK